MTNGKKLYELWRKELGAMGQHMPLAWDKITRAAQQHWHNIARKYSERA